MFEYGPLPPLMFLSMIVFMLYGFPVAFSLGAVGLAFGAIGILTDHFDASFIQAMPRRVFGIISNELLLAIPFFTFMGAILERSGLAEDMLEGMGKLFGRVPGGLAYAVIVVGAILGAVTGTVAASVITIGVIALPIMLRNGYNERLATGVIAASGTITQVIPPSLVLIVLAEQLEQSVGDMYLGAFGPSIAQVLIFLAFILVMSILRPQTMPPLPLEVRGEASLRLVLKVLWGIVPSLVLIFLVLGTIFMGLATPTESGALGVVGAMVLAALNRRLSWSLVSQAMTTTATLTAMVVFILIGATAFTVTFQFLDGGEWIKFLLSHLPGGQLGFLIFVNIFIFFLAFFLDFFEIAFIVLPLLVPVARELGIDMIWFGVLICINMQTAFMHPPFGFALFYLRSIAPRSLATKQIYLGAIPWLGLQLLLVVVVIFWPGLVTGMLDRGPKVDPNSVQIVAPSVGGGLGQPGALGQPGGLSQPGGLGQPGGLTQPAPSTGSPAPVAPAQPGGTLGGPPPGLQAPAPAP